MQRRIVFVAVGVMALVLIALSGLYGYREFLRPQPASIWLSLVLRADLSEEHQEYLVTRIEEQMQNEILLRNIVIRAELKQGLNQPSEEAALAELKQRMFFRISTTESAGTIVPCIHIGVNGNDDERLVLEKTAMMMIQEVWRIVGIDADTGMPAGTPSIANPTSF